MTVEVEVLTRDHKRAIRTVDGIEFHSVPSLISQLRDAIFGGMESTGGSAYGSKLPISAGALDLYMLIDRWISEVWVAAFNRPPNTDRPEVLLSEWAAFIEPDAVVSADGREYTAEQFVSHVQRRIDEFFDPPRLSEISADCIVCEARHVFTRVDGEDIRSSALRFRRDKDTGETLDARCMSCGVVWLPHQFEYLAEKIGIDVARKRAEHEGEGS